MRPKNFFDFFPPPEFLNIPYAGIAISDTSIRCIQFYIGQQGLHLSKFTEKPLPPGAVTSGFINDSGVVSDILKSLKMDLGINHIKVSLPEEKAYLFTTSIPKVAQKDIRSAIEFKMEENVPIPASDLVFDFLIPNPNAHDDHFNVVVSALPVSVVDVYIETVRLSGLSLLSLEIESQAVARSLLSESDSSACIIAYFGQNKVGLYVACCRVVHFTSTISTKGIPDDDLSYLSLEIKKLQNYWQTLKENENDNNKIISRVIVCGEYLPDDLDSRLYAKLHIKVIYGNVWSNAFDINKTVPEISHSDSLKYAPAVGLALPSKILL
jgi:hypothetical protein